MDSVTHYMGLLMANQPWNLIIFMAIPVILAETLAITEFFVLFRKDLTGTTRKVNRVVGIVAGCYFLGIFIYLWQNAVVPIYVAGEWRGIADYIAVGFYLSGVIPLLGITILEIKAIIKKTYPLEQQKLHVVLIAVFLIVAHIAMIFGMMNPSVLGYRPQAM